MQKKENDTTSCSQGRESIYKWAVTCHGSTPNDSVAVWNTSLSLFSEEKRSLGFAVFIPLMMYDVANQYFKNSKVRRYTVLKTYFRPLQVTCSYLQIYQERVYDLLGSEKSGPEVFLREHPKKGMVIDWLIDRSIDR